ncbi:N(6)-L-threonylcarbamoyladenine synthase Kae1 [Candidatus Bathyarchaeota archaeon]|nr:N(6)-L-threonylcarbamoyladenine synthase Kae1 [Candidatus Bathyarchaeota archaeon]
MHQKTKICLGIESTAHTFGVSIASENEILSDVKSVYTPPAGRGIHPREAAQHHAQVAYKIVYEALKEAKVKSKDVDAIAFSMGPGLGPALRVGATIARALAAFLNKPLIPVHHGIGHIELAALTTSAKDPLTVIVSGGHTALVAFARRRWRVFGETEDITLGNLLDMFAREAGIPPPGGGNVEKLAETGEKFIDLPYTVKGNDVSYSGLLTAALKLKENVKLEDLCYSLQEVAFAMLTEATERCLAHTEKKELLLTGGVAANARLQQMLKSIAEEHNAKFYVVNSKFSGDCGAQIAWTGLLAFKSGIKIKVEESFIKPKWRLDKVDIPWRK